MRCETNPKRQIIVHVWSENDLLLIIMKLMSAENTIVRSIKKECYRFSLNRNEKAISMKFNEAYTNCLAEIVCFCVSESLIFSILFPKDIKNIDIIPTKLKTICTKNASSLPRAYT